MAKIKIFRAIPELCTGCDMCTITCSLTKTGKVNPSSARIRIDRSGGHEFPQPIICRHCKKPSCLAACRVEGAMHLDRETGAVVINEAKCVRCLDCMNACPFGAIQVSPVGEMLKCDLCGGDPVCIKHCSPRPERSLPLFPYPKASCLEYVEPDRLTRKLAHRSVSPLVHKEAANG